MDTIDGRLTNRNLINAAQRRRAGGQVLRRGLAAVGLALLLFAPATPAAAAGADEPVARLNAVLLESMRNADRLGFDGRFDLLAPVLADVFNFGRMAQSAVGRSWNASAEADRELYVDIFTRLSIAEFAARFDGFSGETFEIGGTVNLPRGWVLVQNNLVKTDGERISINYVVRQDDVGWQIYDIRLNNTISELQLKRDEFTSVLRSTDLPGLARLLEQKIARLENRS